MEQSWQQVAGGAQRFVESWAPALLGVPAWELLGVAALMALGVGLLALLVAVLGRRGPGSGERSAEDLEHDVQRLIEANAYVEAGDLRAGQGQFDKALALYLHGGNRNKAALCHLSLKQPDRAARLYLEDDRLAEAAHHFQTAGLWLEAAQCLDRLGSQREAAELYERAGELAKAANLLRSLGEADNAARLFERAGLCAEAAAALIEAHGRDARVLHRAGELFSEASEPHRAAECFAAAGEWTAAAEIFEDRGEHMLAAQAFERAELFERSAVNYLEAGALPEARTNFERAGDRVRVAQLDLKLGNLLEAGRAYHELGAVDRAIEILQRVQAESPQASAATLLLGRIFMEKRLYARAREHLEAIAPPEPRSKTDLEVLLMLADTYEGQGEAAQAAQLLEQIAQVDPDFGNVQERLERVQEVAWSDSNPPPGYYDSRYELRAEIGRGGMGVVHLADDQELGRSVAIKFLPPDLAMNAAAVTMFRNEARAAAAMNHPNIVHVYDVGVLANRPCIIMEFVAGHTARELLKEAKREGRCGLGPRRVAEIARDMARALSYAHTQNVIHRDVKPSNMLISQRGEAKLMDFGISKVLEAGDAAGEAKGTPQYMPPEQILAREIDGRTDLYALGISMFELLTGRRPFVGDKVLEQQLHDPVPDPHQIDPGVHEDLARIVLRLCEKEAENRYGSAEELVAALDVFLTPSV